MDPEAEFPQGNALASQNDEPSGVRTGIVIPGNHPELIARTVGKTILHKCQSVATNLLWSIGAL